VIYGLAEAAHAAEHRHRRRGGAFPPLIGWVAATGHVTLMPVLLFLIIFMWTPPHFWALALFVQTDYAKVGIPMMPVVAGEKATRRQMLAYAVLLLPPTLVPWFIGGTGLVYGCRRWCWGWCSWRSRSASACAPACRTNEARKAPVRLFGLYLFVLFARWWPIARHGARLASMNPNDDHLSPAESEAYRARQRARAGLGLTLARWRCCSSRSRS
jgi:protoheme IX farnesyltransferase